VQFYLLISYAVFTGGINIWAVVGGSVAALAAITLVIAIVVLVRRIMQGSGNGDNSDLSSLKDLSTDIAKSVKTIK
jgi:hypothetical protein